MYVGWRGEQHAAYTSQITGRRACRQDRVDWPPRGTSVLRSTAATCMRARPRLTIYQISEQEMHGIFMHDASGNGNSAMSATPRLSLLSVRGDQIIDTAG